MQGLNSYGKKMCDALSVLFYNSVSERYAPQDEVCDPGELHEYDARDTILKYGFEEVGKGISRRVFLLPDSFTRSSSKLVIKMSRPTFETDNTPSGIEQNKAEEQMYANSRGTEWADFFASVLNTSHHNTYIVMPYYDPLNELDGDGELLESAHNRVESSPWDFEVKPENIGVTEGEKPILIDYGVVDRSSREI